MTSEQGIRVINVFSTTDFSWGEIRGFEIGRSGLFPLVCLIRIDDGSTKHAFGIQERTNFPNGSAERVTEELNAELARRSGKTLDGWTHSADSGFGSGGSPSCG